jgi:hypothetical protein
LFSYCGSLNNVVIPSSLSKINWAMFNECRSLTCVAIPDSVTSIEGYAFGNCTSLTNVIIGRSATYIGDHAFECCYGLSSISIPDSVTRIGDFTFHGCPLTSITFPCGITNIGSYAFEYCWSMSRIYFKGNAPSIGVDPFYFDGATVYYLPGTTGWNMTFAGLSTALWFQPTPVILNGGRGFGVQTNQFGFTISWATNASVVVEACTNLANPDWQPVQTNALTSGSVYFSDPQWTNYPARFYRLRSP